jgi:formamidopyrimidine-DNA glycosylase
MPELPEVEITMRALAARLAGRRVAGLVQRRADIRFPLPDRLGQRLEGRMLVRFARRAKYIECFLDDGAVLLLHLGMSGRLVFDGEPCGPHEHLTFAFDDGTLLRFVDPRRFGMVDLWPAERLGEHRWLTHLGLEPLDHCFGGRSLRAVLDGRRTALKVALMDQRLVVGVGNIYASESLFRARLGPSRPAGGLSLPEAQRLARSIRQVLREAIEAGGSSLRDYVQSNGELGNFQRRFRVYDRAGEPCLVCGGPIGRALHGARATFYCAVCQR